MQRLPPPSNPYKLPIFLGLLAVTAVALLIRTAWKNQAVQEHNRQMELAADERAEERMRSIQAVPHLVVTPASIATVHAVARAPLPDGMRCIDGRLYRKLPDGREQVAKASGKPYCG